MLLPFFILGWQAPEEVNSIPRRMSTNLSDIMKVLAHQEDALFDSLPWWVVFKPHFLDVLDTTINFDSENILTIVNDAVIHISVWIDHLLGTFPIIGHMTASDFLLARANISLKEKLEGYQFTHIKFVTFRFFFAQLQFSNSADFSQ